MSTEDGSGADDSNGQELDALLRQSFQRESARSPGDATPDCLDAETLAAWGDGALAPHEVRAVEAHAAGCVRCQAMLAAFTRSEPLVEPFVPAAIVEGASTKTSGWRISWLVPLVATAAALAIWVATPSTPMRETATEKAIQVPAAPNASASGATEADFSPAPVPAREAPPPLRAAAPSPDASASAAVAAAAPEANVSTPKAAPDSVAPEGASAYVAPLTEAPSSAEVISGMDRFRQTPELREEPAATLADKRSAAPTPPLPRAMPRAIGSSTIRTDVQVVGAGADRWRIRHGTVAVVEFSASGGREWAAAATPPGTPGTLAAGAAPGGRVCWLVGTQGVVLLTTDGVSFRQLAFPETVDLTFVDAADARRATARSADGRTFTTADGGTSWTAHQP